MSDPLVLLARTALLGTARQPLVWPDGLGALQPMVRSLEQDDPAIALLRGAGMVAVCAEAGRAPARLTNIPAAAPDEAGVATASPGETRAIAALLADGGERTLHVLFDTLAAANRVLPPVLLPDALALGTRQKSLRDAVRPRLGVRGNWLAGQASEWHWAFALQEDNTEYPWETATHEQRMVLVQKLLPTRPLEARARLRDGLSSSAARERLQWLELLVPFVTPDDEPLLDSLLADRSKEVRLAAAGALSCLPGSAFAARRTSQLAALLVRETRLLRQEWEFTPPEKFDVAWKADAIDEQKPKHEPVGERAWWALQSIRFTPLSWWTTHTGMEPPALLAWSRKSDWRDVLLRGWSDAVVCQGNRAWAEAWLACLDADGPAPNVEALLALLGEEGRDAWWARRLQAAGTTGALCQVVDRLGTRSTSFSFGLAAAVLAALQAAARAAGEQYRDYALTQALPELAALMPAGTLPDLLQPALIEGLAPRVNADGINRFRVIAENRLQLTDALREGRHE